MEKNDQFIFPMILLLPSSGLSMLATGVFHTVYACMSPKLGHHLIPKEGTSLLGFWAFKKDANGLLSGWETFGAAWFLISGPLLTMLGYMMHIYTRDTRKPIPASIGWSLVALGGIGCLAFPISGFWLIWPQGLFIVYKANQHDKTS